MHTCTHIHITQAYIHTAHTYSRKHNSSTHWHTCSVCCFRGPTCDWFAFKLNGTTVLRRCALHLPQSWQHQRDERSSNQLSSFRRSRSVQLHCSDKRGPIVPLHDTRLHYTDREYWKTDLGQLTGETKAGIHSIASVVRPSARSDRPINDRKARGVPTRHSDPPSNSDPLALPINPLDHLHSVAEWSHFRFSPDESTIEYDWFRFTYLL